MHIRIKRLLAVSLTLTAAVLLGACGNVSRDVARNGKSAGTLVWPSPDSTIAIHKGGTFPDRAELREVKSGLNKRQIAALIGYPHFNEGVWGVREWDYLFNFRAPHSDQVTTCQFKILFDEQKLARSFYWKPESCARFAARRSAASPSMSAASVVRKRVETFTLAADALFPFDKSSISDITPEGLRELDDVAVKLKKHLKRISSIHVVGYTDRLGNDAYDKALSERRADAVLAYLVGKGVPSEQIVAAGYGKLDPVKTCPDTLARKALIACLAPNRRVVVRAVE